MTKYEVLAATGYAGIVGTLHRQGDTFQAELTPEQERRALERGLLRVVKETKPKGGKGADE